MIPTIDDAIDRAKKLRQAAERRREAALRTVAAVQTIAQQHGRSRLTAEEDHQVETATRAHDAAVQDRDEADHELRQLQLAKQTTDEEDRLMTMTTRDASASAPRPAYDRMVRIGQEERTYRPDRDRTGKGFLLDVTRAALFHDVQASERLGRHAHEESTLR